MGATGLIEPPGQCSENRHLQTLKASARLDRQPPAPQHADGGVDQALVAYTLDRSEPFFQAPGE